MCADGVSAIYFTRACIICVMQMIRTLRLSLLVHCVAHARHLYSDFDTHSCARQVVGARVRVVSEPASGRVVQLQLQPARR